MKKRKRQVQPLSSNSTISVSADSPKYAHELQKKWLYWGLGALVAVITFLVYLPSLQNGFVNWDDQEYVYENPNIRYLNLDFIKWTLSSVYFYFWQPLTMISYALDYAVWRLNPFGYHLTSVIFHAANTFLVFVLTIRLLEIGKLRRYKVEKNLVNSNSLNLLTYKLLITGLVTSLLFGIHPLHVESVAWVSERKDVLYAFFYLLSVLAYLRYTRENSRKAFFYIVCLILFILSLMSKPMAVTLPVVFLILDFYPMERFQIREGSKNVKWVVIEKAPFVLLSLLFALITVYAQAGGALQTTEEYPLLSRFIVAMYSYLFYLIKMVFPFHLAPFYPYPNIEDLFTFSYIGSGILFSTVTFFCICISKRAKLFKAIWFYYIVTLLPVIGIVKVGDLAAADRYTYMSSLGPFLLAGLGVGWAFERCQGRYRAVIGVALLLLTGILINKTLTQTALWRDSVTLWSQEIKLFPDAEIAYINRGEAYSDLGHHQLAIRDHTKAIEINPRYEAYYNRGVAYSNLSDYTQAIADFSMALKLNPRQFNAYIYRGNAYGNIGDHQQAIRDHTKAIELNPRYAEGYYNRGTTYLELGDAPQAIKDYNIVIELNPRHGGAYGNRGNAYRTLGYFQDAVRDYTMVIEIDHRDTRAYMNRGLAYSNLSDHQQAVRDYTKAINLNPSDAIAYKLRGLSYRKLGNYQLMLNDLKIAVEMNPEDSEAHYYLNLFQGAKSLGSEPK